MRAVRALLATLLVAVTGLPVLLAAPAARAAEPESWARISIGPESESDDEHQRPLPPWEINASTSSNK